MKSRKRSVDKKLVVKVPNLVQKFSTLDLLKDAFKTFLDSKKKTKRSAIKEDGMASNPRQWPKVHHLALVVNDELVDVMMVQPKFAAVLLSQPKFVEVTEETHQNLVLGSKYVDGVFVQPENTHRHGEKNEL